MITFLVLAIVVPPIVTVVMMRVLARSESTRSDGELDADSLGFVGGTLNAIYIVVLAFYVVFAWQTGDDIDSGATAEANALIDLHHQVSVAAVDDRDAIRSLARDYAKQVADTEWQRLAAGGTDPKVDEILGGLRDRVGALPSDAEPINTARQYALTDLRQLDEAHRARVSDSDGDSVFNATLLVGTVVGSALMIVFPLAIGITPARRHVIVMGTMAVILGAMVYISVDMMDPLTGLFANDPDAFRDALDLFSAAK